MNIALQTRLFKKYPKIFKQKDLLMKETCMCWGIACGDGWYWLIDKVCALLQWDIDKNNYPQIEFTQVKEKFGTLRIYTSGHTDKQDGIIDLATSLSSSICENCGSTKNVTQTKGYIKTLCEECIKK